MFRQQRLSFFGENQEFARHLVVEALAGLVDRVLGAVDRLFDQGGKVFSLGVPDVRERARADAGADEEGGRRLDALELAVFEQNHRPLVDQRVAL